MKNNFSNSDQKTNKNDMNKVESDARMRAQNRDIINEGKDLAKNPPKNPPKNQSKDCKNQ